MRRSQQLIAVIMIACVAQVAGAQSSIEEAKQFFQKCITLEKNFDPSAADLYSDKAIIRNTRRYPDGSKRTIEIPVAKYRELIRTLMPVAKARGDRNRYSNVKYAQEGNNVRITATRYSLLKKYSSPVSMLIGVNDKGEWEILESISESIP